MKSDTHEAMSYRQPLPREFESVRAMARRSFAETFARRYDPLPFEKFLDDSYGPGGSMADDLENPLVRWLVGFASSVPVGYVKLTPVRAPVAAPRPGALELQQIYVLKRWHGTGVAGRLMEWALDTATAAHAPEVYLTVFDHNERAKRFYTRYGFGEVGQCTVTIAGRIDEDRIWRRSLSCDET